MGLERRARPDEWLGDGRDDHRGRLRTQSARLLRPLGAAHGCVMSAADRQRGAARAAARGRGRDASSAARPSCSTSGASTTGSTFCTRTCATGCRSRAMSASTGREREYTRRGREANWFDEGKDTLQQARGCRSRAAIIGPRSRARARRISSPMCASRRSRDRTSPPRAASSSAAPPGARCRSLHRQARRRAAPRAGALKMLRRTIYLDQSVLLSRNLTTFF